MLSTIVMKQYTRPDIAEISEELVRIICDSLVGGSVEDFAGSEEIEW